MVVSWWIVSFLHCVPSAIYFYNKENNARLLIHTLISVLGIVIYTQRLLCVILFHVTVNQQILEAIKFGVSQNKLIWRLLNLASPRLCSERSTYDHVCWRDIY